MGGATWHASAKSVDLVDRIGGDIRGEETLLRTQPNERGPFAGAPLIVDDPQHAETLQAMRAALLDVMQACGDPAAETFAKLGPVNSEALIGELAERIGGG